MNPIIVMLGQIHPSIATLQGGARSLFLFIMALTLVFFLFYIVKGCQVGSSLWRCVRAISALRRPNNAPDPAEVAMVLSGQPLTQLWDDYAATLHVLHNTVRKTSSSALILSEFRSTVQAATIFTRENLVDGRLFRAFTRHLPGLLIGLGIVGALLSLLGALPDPWSPAEPGVWMAGVEHALVVVTSGIACALLVLFSSELMLAGFHPMADQLQRAIDGLYASGAREDYLARLVQTSEAGNAQIAQLKEALALDLPVTLGTLAQQQTASHEDAMQALGQRMMDAIAATLALPLQRIGDAMQHTAKGNAEQLAALLDALSNAFMTRLEQSFGGQLLGLHEHMQASTQTMAAVQASLQGLLDNVARISAQTADAQQQSRLALDETVSKMLVEVVTVLDALAAARSDAVNDEHARSERLSLRASELLGGLTSQVDTLLGAAADQGRQTQGSIDAFGQVALQAIEGMQRGAQRFETAGEAVGAIFERSSGVSDQLSAVSLTLQKGLDQYDAIRIAVDAQVAVLMDLIESAKQEAGVSQELVADLKASAAAMRVAEDASRKHLEGVNDALFKAFSDFGNAMVSQVKSTIAETDRHLAQGTGHLNGVIVELSHAVRRIRQGDA